MTDELFPEHCTCGCPLVRTHDIDTRYQWASYKCGTYRAGKGSELLYNGSMTDRTKLCRYIANLKRQAGLTKAQAVRVWEKS